VRMYLWTQVSVSALAYDVKGGERGGRAVE
jgi:hypothetical protein